MELGKCTGVVFVATEGRSPREALIYSEFGHSIAVLNIFVDQVASGYAACR